ncbi:MAG TPA: hypothetical protein VGJ62_10460 [Gemmatimonadaceae bacterium]
MARLSVTRPLAFATLVAVVAAASCKRGNQASSDTMASSLIFDKSSPEAREALATPVDFRLTDANYAQWEQAQNNLDALPRSALRPASSGGGSAIDRAVARLESSPRARRAIESTGLAVRDFVLETVALAQATEAAETGKSTSSAPVPADNFQFVQRYRSRILRSRAEARLARAQAGSYNIQSDTAEQSGADVNLQMENAASEREAQVRIERDSANERAKRDSASRESGQRMKQNGEPVRDTVRDTVPSR